jgi:hypothetical protein
LKASLISHALLGLSLSIEEWNTRSVDKYELFLLPVFMFSSACGSWGGKQSVEPSQQEGYWMYLECLIDGMTEVVWAKGKGKHLFHFWLELYVLAATLKCRKEMHFQGGHLTSLNPVGPYIQLPH